MVEVKTVLLDGLGEHHLSMVRLEAFDREPLEGLNGRCVIYEVVVELLSQYVILERSARLDGTLERARDYGRRVV